MTESNGIVVGIDASNLRRGGGITHLKELLAAANPEDQGISKVVVWGGTHTLSQFPDRPWLEKICPPALNRSLLQRAWWQRFTLSKAAHNSGCKVLFVPGGSYAGSFEPIVTMSQNLLPFEWPELSRYGWSILALKLAILRYVQSSSFRRAAGVIFLTEYAKAAVMRVTGPLPGRQATIAHGLSQRFLLPPPEQLPFGEYGPDRPCRLLYVSIIDQYKHQWHVAEAVHSLREAGFNVTLDLVGPAYPPALRRLREVIARLDPSEKWLRYHGAVPYVALHEIYAKADLGIFASSCENLPIILLETMAAGLPVACSNRGPMPEVLGDAGLYFHPEYPEDIAQSIRQFIQSAELRREKAQAGVERCRQYSWKTCADRTLAFLSEIAGANPAALNLQLELNTGTTTK